MNYKSHFRRHQARRQNERRTNPFPFNSPEWLAFMQDNFELWPKHERRVIERRASERRILERRTRHRNTADFRDRLRTQASFSKHLLLEEERKMIMDLFQED